jgi:D-alanyl-D-alanine dipeptidase
MAAPATVRADEPLPKGFCYVDQVIQDAVLDVRYYTTHNFVGERIDGYQAPRVILTEQAAEALARVQASLAPFGLGLLLFDGYRPQQAVDHFVRWAENLGDQRMKAEFYPDVAKEFLIRDGYIAMRSGHSRGSTVDLTLIDLATGKALDMGTPFDFFGPLSWPNSPRMSAQIRANRALLQGVMDSHGFRHLPEEWWHFTLRGEPYPDTYFDFPVR